MVSEGLLAICLSQLTVAVSAVLLFADNNTMCPWSNPYMVFQDYGYQDDNIPRDLHEYRPSLMHEESVLHLVDHLKQFKLVGHGGNAKVYEGRLKTTGDAVVVKTLTDGGFEELLHEARVMSYLQDSWYVPRLYGLIPAGPTVDNLSLVAEYIENSTSVDTLLHVGHPLSECSWISIIQQTMDALLELHTKFVLFNDLHMNNLIVSWNGSQPHVHIIDFGHATFRKGKSYSNVQASIRGEFDFLPPEVWYTVSTPASDVFSLGKGLVEIGKYINSSQLLIIAGKCVSVNPKDRPPLQNIMDFMDDLFKARCYDFNNDTLTEVWNESSDRVTENDFNSMPIPLLSWDSLKTIKSNNHYIWLRYSNQTHILVAHYKPTNIKVVVKMFFNISFYDIRHEVVANQIMNDTGYVPLFLGVAETGTSLDNICLVQEYFAEGQTLKDVFDTFESIDFSIKIVLALELAEALTQFHNKGLIINNFKADNILIEFMNSYPVIKLIDLGKCSFNREYILGLSDESLKDIEYLAPELTRQMMTSQASDVYSLGVILLDVFRDTDNEEICEIISLCLEDDPSVRPSALQVKISVINVMSNLIHDDA